MTKSVSSKTRLFFSLLPFALFWIVVSNYRLLAWIIPGYTLYDAQRIMELGLLFITALTLIFIPGQRRFWLALYYQLNSWARLGLFVFLLLGLVSSSLAAVPRYAFLQVSVYFFLFVFALYIASQRISFQSSFDRFLLAVIFLGMVVYEGCFIKVYITALVSHVPYNPFPGYANLRFLADVLSWTLALTVLLFFTEKVRNSFALKILFFVIGSLWWMIMFVNKSRGLYFVLIMVTLFTVIFFKSRATLFLKWLVSMAFTGLALCWVFFYSGLVLSPGRIPLTDSSSSFIRLAVWKWAITKIKLHPFLGWGPLHCYFFGISGNGQWVGNPHNSILQIGIGWGIPATLLLLSVIVYSYLRWIKFAKLSLVSPSFESVLPMALVFSLLTGGLDSLGCIVIMTPPSQVLMSVIAGWALSCCFASRSVEALMNATFSSVVFMLMLLFFLIAMMAGVFPDILYLPAIEMRYSFLRGWTEPFTPGFWQQGIFTLKGYFL